MRGCLHEKVLAALVALLFGVGSEQLAYAEDDPIWVGSKTFTGNQAQVQSQPETLRSDPTTVLNARLIRLPEVSNASVKSQMTQDAGGPTKIGFPREVPELKTQQNTQTQLDWKPVPDGMVGSLAINSTGAAALRLGIRVQSLPDSAEVRFFSDRATEVTKVSGRTINEMVQLNLKAGDPEETARMYWSPVIQGDVIGLEVFLPQGTSMDQVGITIPNLSHLVVDPSGSLDTVKAMAGADSCNLDVMCYPEWFTTSNAVGQMVYSVGGNSFLCTGTLLNDQGSTGTPYFLTANHCISSQSTASTLQTYWFYHSSACNSGVPYSGIQTIPAGSTLLYNSSVTDTAFLRLNSQPPAGVTFAGWTTNTPIIGTSSTGPHNPQGDLQKISFGSFAGFQSCLDTAQGFNCSPASEATGSFLQILYSQGITEGVVADREFLQIMANIYMDNLRAEI